MEESDDTGDAETASSNPCKGWESDPDSMAIRIAKTCASDCLKWPSTVAVLTIDKTSPVGVNFDNGEKIVVEWDRSAKTATATWVKGDATRGGASFTYTCTSSGELDLSMTGCSVF